MKTWTMGAAKCQAVLSHRLAVTGFHAGNARSTTLPAELSLSGWGTAAAAATGNARPGAGPEGAAAGAEPHT